MIKAYRFLPIADMISHGGSATVCMDDISGLSGAEVEGFANLMDDGTIEDVDGPSNDPMVLLAVGPHKGTLFHILTDGDKYYPLKGSVHLVYDDRFASKYRPLSEVDHILIKEAIKYFSSMFV